MSSIILGRFDFNFLRNDKISASEFLKNCQRRLKQTNRNVSLEKNSKGSILKIGTRRNKNYSRIYEVKNL